jgi:hypothetical protein
MWNAPIIVACGMAASIRTPTRMSRTSTRTLPSSEDETIRIFYNNKTYDIVVMQVGRVRSVGFSIDSICAIHSLLACFRPTERTKLHRCCHNVSDPLQLTFRALFGAAVATGDVTVGAD